MCNYKTILGVIIPLVIVIKFLPGSITKNIVSGLFDFVLDSRLDRANESGVVNPTHWRTLHVVLIACFIVTLIICILLRGNKCGSYLFHSWILTCLIIEVALCSYIHYKNEDLCLFVKDWIRDSPKKYNKPGHDYIKIIWNDLQTQLKCCGITGAIDWSHQRYFNQTSEFLPQSCCKNRELCKDDSYDVWPGCRDKMDTYFKENALLILWALGGLAVAKVAAVIVSYIFYPQLVKVFLISPVTRSKITNRLSRIGSTKRCQCHHDVPLEKM